MIRVMFVCTGNICRSPTAEGILRHQIRERGLTGEIEACSSGMIAYHVGESPDPRAVKLAARRGYDLSGQTASQIRRDDFYDCDYILAMDTTHYTAMHNMAPADTEHKISLLLDHLPDTLVAEVPDPYYDDDAAFIETFELVEAGVIAFLDKITN